MRRSGWSFFRETCTWSRRSAGTATCVPAPCRSFISTLPWSCSQEWICSAIWGRSGGFLMNWDFLEDILGAVQKESVGGLLYLKAVFSRLVYDFFEQGAGGDAYLDSFPRLLPPAGGPGLSGGASERRAPYPGAGGCHGYAGPSAFQVLPAGYKDGIKRIYVPQLAQRARQMLGHTDMPVWEVAETLGFTDPYYFSRFFKKYEKLSPREYRKLRF